MYKNNSIKIQLIMNFVPLAGVIFANWSVFALIYSFWLETLGISFFNSIKIAAAQQSDSRPPHIFRASKYFIGQLFVLLFYMIFILVFVGIMISSEQEGAKFMNYLLFIDPSFRYAILTFLMTKTIQLVYDYFLNGQYKKSNPDEFSNFFNPRMIVIHVVVVLGVFAHQFASKSFDAKTGIIAFATVFVVVKSIADFIIHSFFSADNRITDVVIKQKGRGVESF